MASMSTIVGILLVAQVEFSQLFLFCQSPFNYWFVLNCHICCLIKNQYFSWLMMIKNAFKNSYFHQVVTCCRRHLIKMRVLLLLAIILVRLHTIFHLHQTILPPIISIIQMFGLLWWSSLILLMVLNVTTLSSELIVRILFPQSWWLWLV